MLRRLTRKIKICQPSYLFSFLSDSNQSRGSRNRAMTSKELLNNRDNYPKLKTIILGDASQFTLSNYITFIKTYLKEKNEKMNDEETLKVLEGILNQLQNAQKKLNEDRNLSMSRFAERNVMQVLYWASAARKKFYSCKLYNEIIELCFNIIGDNFIELEHNDFSLFLTSCQMNRRWGIIDQNLDEIFKKCQGLKPRSLSMTLNVLSNKDFNSTARDNTLIDQIYNLKKKISEFHIVDAAKLCRSVSELNKIGSHTDKIQEIAMAAFEVYLSSPTFNVFYVFEDLCTAASNLSQLGIQINPRVFERLANDYQKDYDYYKVKVTCNISAILVAHNCTLNEKISQTIYKKAFTALTEIQEGEVSNFKYTEKLVNCFPLRNLDAEKSMEYSKIADTIAYNCITNQDRLGKVIFSVELRLYRSLSQRSSCFMASTKTLCSLISSLTSKLPSSSTATYPSSSLLVSSIAALLSHPQLPASSALLQTYEARLSPLLSQGDFDAVDSHTKTLLKRVEPVVNEPRLAEMIRMM